MHFTNLQSKILMLSIFKSKPKAFKRLFLVCPTWCLEQRFRKKFGENSYFMNAIAGVFVLDESQIIQIEDLVKRQDIDKICVVANPNCQFVKNIIKPINYHYTKAEELLAKIYHKKYDDIHQESTLEDQCLKLSIYNAELQVAYLKREPQLLVLMENYNLDLSVMINHTASQV